MGRRFKYGGSGSQDASSSDGLYSPLCGFTEELGLDDDGLVGESALAEDFEVAGFGHVDNGDAVLVLCVLGLGGLTDQAPLSKARITILSMLMAGLNSLLRLRWKNLIPFLPKYPGWYLSNRVLMWVSPPALPALTLDFTSSS